MSGTNLSMFIPGQSDITSWTALELMRPNEIVILYTSGRRAQQESRYSALGHQWTGRSTHASRELVSHLKSTETRSLVGLIPEPLG